VGPLEALFRCHVRPDGSFENGAPSSDGDREAVLGERFDVLDIEASAVSADLLVVVRTPTEQPVVAVCCHGETLSVGRHPESVLGMDLLTAARNPHLCWDGVDVLVDDDGTVVDIIGTSGATT